MNPTRTLALTVAVAVAGAALPAAAQSRSQSLCGERNALLKGLEQGYGERPTARGLDSMGRMIEVLTGPSGSWTIIVTNPGGQTCMSGSGEAWSIENSPGKTDPAA